MHQKVNKTRKGEKSVRTVWWECMKTSSSAGNRFIGWMLLLPTQHQQSQSGAISTDLFCCSSWYWKKENTRGFLVVGMYSRCPLMNQNHTHTLNTFLSRQNVGMKCLWQYSTTTTWALLNKLRGLSHQSLVNQPPRPKERILFPLWWFVHSVVHTCNFGVFWNTRISEEYEWLIIFIK